MMEGSSSVSTAVPSSSASTDSNPSSSSSTSSSSSSSSSFTTASLAKKDPVNILLIVVSVLLLFRIYFIDLRNSPDTDSINEIDSMNDFTTGGSNNHKQQPIHLATPTSIPGPAALRPLYGHCTIFRQSDSMSYEVCPYKTVRQIFTGKHLVYHMGYFREWKIDEKVKQTEDRDKYLSQHYRDGDNCPGFRDRETIITYACKPDSDKLEMIHFGEAVPCIYEITIASKHWCTVEKYEKEREEETAETVAGGNKGAGGRRQLRNNSTSYIRNSISIPEVSARPSLR